MIDGEKRKTLFDKDGEFVVVVKRSENFMAVAHQTIKI